MQSTNAEDVRHNSTVAEEQFLQAIQDPEKRSRELLLEECFLLILNLSDDKLKIVFERMAAETR